MPKENLKVSIIIEHNGEKRGNGVDYSEFFEEGQKLTREHVMKTLTLLCSSTTTWLQQRKLAYPYIDIGE